MNNALIYIPEGAVFDIFGDLLMKNWVVSSSKIHFAGGMLFYIIGLSFLLYNLRSKTLLLLQLFS